MDQFSPRAIKVAPYKSLCLTKSINIYQNIFQMSFRKTYFFILRKKVTFKKI